jgi:DNA-binding IclR family transcriptional regulator
VLAKGSVQLANDAGSGVKSVHLALDVLEAVAAEVNEVGVSELAQKLGTTKATIFRHLRTLTDRKYLVQSSVTHRYRIGVRSHMLGQSAAGRIDIISSSHTEIEDLREETGETVVLSTAGPSGIMVLTTHLGKSALEIGVRPGSTLPPHSSAQGKIALAFGDAELLKKTLSSKLVSLTPHTITDKEKLKLDVQKARELGYAVAPQETLLGVNAIAAPIMDGEGVMVGSIAIVGSIQNIEEAPRSDQIFAVQRSAQRVSWNLGFTGLMPFQQGDATEPTT